MLFKTGVELEASFGVRPFHEGDLILRVGDESINKAQSIEDIIKFVDAAIPFIELPDIIFSKQVKISGKKEPQKSRSTLFGNNNQSNAC